MVRVREPERSLSVGCRLVAGGRREGYKEWMGCYHAMSFPDGAIISIKIKLRYVVIYLS